MNGKLIVLWLLIICIAAGAARKKSKKSHTVKLEVRKPNCPTEKIYGCTKIWHPVCGSDGKTYGNECMLCLEISESKKSIMVAKNGRC